MSFLFKFIAGVGLKAKLYAAAFVGFLALLATAWAKGHSAATQRAENANMKRRLDAIKEKQKIEKDISNADKDDIVDINTRR